MSGRKVYEGKAKILYETEDPGVLVSEFKDEATAFNGRKKGIIRDKGAINCQVSAVLFAFLEQKGIPTHFIRLISEHQMLVKRLKIIPLEVVVRNVAAGSLAARLGLEEGTRLERPVLEFYYKKDELGDPLLNEYHIYAIDLATPAQVGELGRLGLSVNEHLKEYFADRGILLVDFKLEFGLHGEDLLLGDEVSPDTCRLWDLESGRKMDKDRFRRDLGQVEDAYQEVFKRVVEKGVVG